MLSSPSSQKELGIRILKSVACWHWKRFMKGTFSIKLADLQTQILNPESNWGNSYSFWQNWALTDLLRVCIFSCTNVFFTVSFFPYEVKVMILWHIICRWISFTHHKLLLDFCSLNLLWVYLWANTWCSTKFALFQTFPMIF